ncbi:MAG: hypothetical protein ACM3X3_09000 [Betaproteobacteria bacterium]
MAKQDLGKNIQSPAKDISRKEALRRVERAMDQVVNGEIIIKMQGGKPIWVDKYERERVG